MAAAPRRQAVGKDGFLRHLQITQAAYNRRDLPGYLGGFSSSYIIFSIDSSLVETKESVRRTMAAEFKKYDLLKMDFKVRRIEVRDSHGYAIIGYKTTLKEKKEMGAIVRDSREVLLVGRRRGKMWKIVCKVIIKVNIDRPRR